MKVDHLHLMVPDVRASAEFFEEYFELRNAGGNARGHAYSFHVGAPGGFLVEVGA